MRAAMVGFVVLLALTLQTTLLSSLASFRPDLALPFVLWMQYEYAGASSTRPQLSSSSARSGTAINSAATRRALSMVGRYQLRIFLRAGRWAYGPLSLDLGRRGTFGPAGITVRITS